VGPFPSAGKGQDDQANVSTGFRTNLESRITNLESRF
jgi:hypothetical protein